MEERWVEVEGYPNYEISNYGVVLSRVNDRPLRARPNDRGYLRVALSRDGVIKDFYIHQLVAQHFVRNFVPGTKIRHYDDDKTNNALYNLRLFRGERVESVHRRRNERLPWGQRVRIAETGEIFRSARDCARHIGGDYSSIYAVLRGERRSHLSYSFEWVHPEEEW